MRARALALTCVLAGAVAATLPATAGASASGAARYLLRTQDRDGSWSNSPLLTGWAVLGLEAAGRNSSRVRRPGGRSALSYLARRARRVGDLGEMERIILAAEASGRSARRFGGRNLVAALVRRQRGGSWQGFTGLTAFGVLALRSAGVRAGSTSVRRAVRFLRSAQNRDGGFGLTRAAAASDIDLTGAAVQALAAAGQRRSRAVSRAMGFLRRSQNGDGGFGGRRGSPSNAQSTAWAVQGVVAARRSIGNFDRGGRTPLRYLISIQLGNGAIPQSASARTPSVFATGQALLALRRRAFPL